MGADRTRKSSVVKVGEEAQFLRFNSVWFCSGSARDHSESQSKSKVEVLQLSGT